MKKLLFFLILIAGLKTVQAQPHLGISSIINVPFNQGDSVYEANTYDSIAITVVNLDSVAISDNIQILIQANSLPTDTLYSDSIPTTIQPGDSVVFIKSGYVFDAVHFDDGDNIIVVWPQALQTPVLADSLTGNVYFISLSADIKNIKNNILTIYPNPSSNYISFKLPEGIMIKQVRILDNSGKLVYRNSSAQKFISTEKWSAGVYFIEVEKTDGSVQYLRFVKN